MIDKKDLHALGADLRTLGEIGDRIGWDVIERQYRLEQSRNSDCKYANLESSDETD